MVVCLADEDDAKILDVREGLLPTAPRPTLLLPPLPTPLPQPPPPSFALSSSLSSSFFTTTPEARVLPQATATAPGVEESSDEDSCTPTLPWSGSRLSLCSSSSPSTTPSPPSAAPPFRSVDRDWGLEPGIGGTIPYDTKEKNGVKPRGGQMSVGIFWSLWLGPASSHATVMMTSSWRQSPL